VRIYFVGIGGEGMCGVAEVAKGCGHDVKGSEIDPRKKTLDELRKLGITIYYTHTPCNVKGAELVVYSSSIPQTHIEVKTAIGHGIPTTKRSQLESTS